VCVAVGDGVGVIVDVCVAVGVFVTVGVFVGRRVGCCGVPTMLICGSVGDGVAVGLVVGVDTLTSVRGTVAVTTSRGVGVRVGVTVFVLGTAGRVAVDADSWLGVAVSERSGVGVLVAPTEPPPFDPFEGLVGDATRVGVSDGETVAMTGHAPSPESSRGVGVRVAVLVASGVSVVTGVRVTVDVWVDCAAVVSVTVGVPARSVGVALRADPPSWAGSVESSVVARSADAGWSIAVAVGSSVEVSSAASVAVDKNVAVVSGVTVDIIATDDGVVTVSVMVGVAAGASMVGVTVTPTSGTVEMPPLPVSG